MSPDDDELLPLTPQELAEMSEIYSRLKASDFL